MSRLLLQHVLRLGLVKVCMLGVYVLWFIGL